MDDSIEDQRTEFTSPSGYTVKSARTQPRPRSARKVAWNEDSSDNAGSTACASSVSSMDPVQTLTDEEKWINDYAKEDKINGEKRQRRVTERPRSGQTIWQSNNDEPLSSTDKPSDVRGQKEDHTEVQELDDTELASTECLSVRPGGSENGRETRPPNATKNGSSTAETIPSTTIGKEEQPQVSPQKAQEPIKRVWVKGKEIIMDEAYHKRDEEKMKELMEKVRYPHGRIRMPPGNCLVCGTHGNPLDNPEVQKDKELYQLCLERENYKKTREAERALTKRYALEIEAALGSKAMSYQVEDAEGNFRPADEKINSHPHSQEEGTMTESTILQRVVSKVRSLVGGDPIESDQNVETDSRCKEGEGKEKAERSLDAQESEKLARELSECNISREHDTGSECSDELPNRERSVRRRFLGWVNDSMKKRYHDKIARSHQREAQEGQSVYVSGFLGRTSLYLGLSRISTRAEREQEKRANLFKAEARRKGMESRWFRWERERRQRKEERLEKEREEQSQSQLAWVLQQNEKADKNLDNYNGSQEYVTENRLLRKEMIGWSRSSE